MALNRCPRGYPPRLYPRARWQGVCHSGDTVSTFPRTTHKDVRVLTPEGGDLVRVHGMSNFAA